MIVLVHTLHLIFQSYWMFFLYFLLYFMVTGLRLLVWVTSTKNHLMDQFWPQSCQNRMAYAYCISDMDPNHSKPSLDMGNLNNQLLLNSTPFIIALADGSKLRIESVDPFYKIKWDISKNSLILNQYYSKPELWHRVRIYPFLSWLLTSDNLATIAYILCLFREHWRRCLRKPRVGAKIEEVDCLRLPQQQVGVCLNYLSFFCQSS